MGIVWREPMNLGVEAIDDDHKRLIDIINEFERVLNACPDDGHLKIIARKLYVYAHGHFSREEAIQRASGYEAHEWHVAEHQQLLAELNSFIRRHFIETGGRICPDTAAEMSHFLKHWLVDHIIKTDLRMKGHLHAVPVRGSLCEAVAAE